MRRIWTGRLARELVFQSVFVTTLTYGLQGWVKIKTVRLQIRMAENGFLRRVAGFSLRDDM